MSLIQLWPEITLFFTKFNLLHYYDNNTILNKVNKGIKDVVMEPHILKIQICMW